MCYSLVNISIKSILLQAVNCFLYIYIANIYIFIANRSEDIHRQNRRPLHRKICGRPLWRLRHSWQALSSCVILHKSLDYSKMQFPHQKFPPPNVTVKIKWVSTPMLKVALSKPATVYKQHKCPLTDKRISKMWYIY